MPLPSPVVLVAVLVAVPLAAQTPQPRYPEAFQLALGLQQRGLHEEAAGKWEQFLQGRPAPELAAEASYRLGVSLLELRRVADAASCFGRALGVRNMRYRAECLYRLGGIEREAGNLAAAAGRFAEIGRTVAGDHYLRVPALYDEGECRRDLGDDQGALAAFTATAESAGKEHPQFLFAAYYQAGFAQQRSGAFAAAAGSFGKAAFAAADEAARAECFYLAGDALLRAGDPAAAQQEFRAAMRIGGDFADDAALGLGFCALRRDEPDAALDAFRQLLAQHQNSPRAVEARLEIGRLLHGRGDFARARVELQALCDDRSLAQGLRTQAEELLGLCALELGEGSGAAAVLRKALEQAPAASRPRLQVALGDALSTAAKWQEALVAYAAVPADATADLRGEALYGQSFCLHQLGRHDDSRARAEELRQQLPNHRLSVHAVFAVAENHFAQRRWADAQAAYGEVPRDHELSPRAAFKAAWCDHLQGRHEEAGEGFGRLAADAEQPFREESLSMAALAWLEAGDQDKALAAADRYRANYRDGAFLARTERVAARVLRLRGDLQGATARLQQAASAAGADDGAGDRLEAADLSFQQGDFASAQRGYAALAPRQDDLGARAVTGLAWCAFELGEDRTCAELVRQGLLHPKGAARQAGLLELRSALHQRREEWAPAAEAAATFLRECGDHPRAPAMRYALGLCQARGGDFANARRTLTQLAGAGGYDRMDRVHYELAWASRKGGDEAAALRSFGKVIELSGDDELQGEARLHVGTAALANKDLDGARQVLAQAKGSHRGRALYLLGFAELQASEAQSGPKQAALRQRAESAFGAVVEIGPAETLHGEATFCLGECLRRRAAHADALAAFATLLQREPKHERAQAARLGAGECAVALGRNDEAVRHLEELLRAGSEGGDRARGMLLLGKARLGRGEHQQAEQAFQAVTALSDGPLAAEAQFRLGESRLGRKDLAAAAEAFVALPILYAHEEWVRKGLLQAGLCYQGLQQADKARRFFEELVRRFPDSAEAQQAKTNLR